MVLGCHRFHIGEPGWSIALRLSHLPHHHQACTDERQPPQRTDFRYPRKAFPSHLLRQQGGISSQLRDEGMEQRHIDVGTSLERADR